MHRIHSLVSILALLSVGCSSILVQPAIDDVKTVALVSVYMNREFYNIKSPKSGEGNVALASLLEAAGAVTAEKVFGKEREEGFILDEVDPDRLRIISYAVKTYGEDLESLGRWRVLPVEKVINDPYYRGLRKKDEKNIVTKFIGAYLDDRARAKWVTPPGFNFIPISSLVDDGNEATESGGRAMAELCRALGVDAVAILELDMGYRFNKLAKVSFMGTTLAVPSIGHSLLVVNRKGQIAVNTGPVHRGSGDRFEGDTVGMVKGDQLVLKHKNDKAVHNYNVALDKSSADLRKRLGKAYSKL